MTPWFLQPVLMDRKMFKSYNDPIMSFWLRVSSTHQMGCCFRCVYRYTFSVFFSSGASDTEVEEKTWQALARFNYCLNHILWKLTKQWSRSILHCDAARYLVIWALSHPGFPHPWKRERRREKGMKTMNYCVHNENSKREMRLLTQSWESLSSSACSLSLRRSLWRQSWMCF